MPIRAMISAQAWVRGVRPISAPTPSLLRRRNPFRFSEGDGDQLAYAALAHGDAEQAVHTRHGERVMGDDDETRRGQFRHLVEQIAETLHIGVVERRIYL